jgi:hypothetical protein
MGIWAFNLNISSHFCVHRVKFVYLTTYLIKAGMKIEKIKIENYKVYRNTEIYPISLFSWGRTVLGNQRSSTYSVF